jgi:hypothetical protein
MANQETSKGSKKEAGTTQSTPRVARKSVAKVATKGAGTSSDLRKADIASDRVGNVRTMLTELGLRESGLAKLDADSVIKLDGLLASEGQRSNLIASMFNAVADQTPAKLTSFLNTIGSYDGKFTILETFLTQLGQRNPYIAAERAQVLVLPSNDTGVARGASGHILTGTTYCAYDRDMATNSTGFLAGKQATGKIFEAFSPNRVSDAARELVRTRRNTELRKALRDIDFESVTLEDLNSDLELREQLGSPLIARNLAVYDELRKAIEEYKGHLSDMVYGGEVLLPGINSLKVRQDPGRQFFGWFEEHFKENAGAPAGIRLAYANLRDEDVALSEAEEAFYLRGLLAYWRMNSYINKTAALSGLVSDLQTYENLDLSDSLRMDSKMETARRTLQQTIAATPTELSITEFSGMLENAAMVQFRTEMNKRVLDLYRDDFEKALQQFEFVSFENGNWREDALGESVPMGRLRKHLYGAKTGVATAYEGPEKKRALLGQHDFRHITDAQFLRRLMSDEEKLLNAKPIAEFKEMIEGVVVAYRKAMLLEARLAEYSTTPSGSGVVASLDRENVGETLAGWKPVLPLGKAFKPAEAWIAETKEPKPTLRSLAEIAARMIDRKSYFLPPPSASNHALRDKYDRWQSEIEVFAKAGLYLPEMDDLWRVLEEKVAPLVPVTGYEETLTTAARVAVHPMVFGAGFCTPELLTRRYVFSHELEKVKGVAELDAQVAKICEGYNTTDLADLRERLGRREWRTLFIGGVGSYSNGRGKLTLKSQLFRKFAAAVETEEGSLYYYDPVKLEEAIDTLDSSFISGEDLGRNWAERAKKLCSKEGKAALDARGFALVDNETYRAGQHLGSLNFNLISRDFVDVVNQMLPNTAE